MPLHSLQKIEGAADLHKNVMEHAINITLALSSLQIVQTKAEANIYMIFLNTYAEKKYYLIIIQVWTHL